MPRKILVLLAVAALTASSLSACTAARPPAPASRPATKPFVRKAPTFALGNVDRPHDIAVDRFESAVWVVSIQKVPGNRLFRFDTKTETSTVWRLPGDGKWAGGPVVATKDAVWIATGPDLVRFDKASHAFKTYRIPAPTRLIDRGPTSHVGVAHVVESGGSVWLSRPYSNSLLEFKIASGMFVDHPLPVSFGSAYELAAAEDGSIWMSVAVSGDSKGIGVLSSDKIGLFDPAAGKARVFPVPAGSLHAVPGGVLFLGPGPTLSKLDAKSGATTARPFLGDFAPFALGADGSVLEVQLDGVVQVAADGDVLGRFTLPRQEAGPSHGMAPVTGTTPTSASAPQGPRYAPLSVTAIDTDANGVAWALSDYPAGLSKCDPKASN